MFLARAVFLPVSFADAERLFWSDHNNLFAPGPTPFVKCLLMSWLLNSLLGSWDSLSFGVLLPLVETVYNNAPHVLDDAMFC